MISYCITHVVLLGLAGLNLEDTAHKVLVRELSSVLSQGKLHVSCNPRHSLLTIPASTHTALSWAPFMSSVDRASSSKLIVRCMQ